MAKFLFCLPRYHTNVVPWVRVLHARGHEVAIHVTQVGPTENHRAVTPLVVQQSAFSTLAVALSSEDRKPLRVSPPVWSYAQRMAREAPDVVIVRGVTRWFSRVAVLAAITQRRRLVIYDQEDVAPAAASTRLRRAAFQCLGIPHVTSRLPVGEFVPRAGSAIPLPFGAPSDPGPPIPAVPGDGPARLLMVAKYRERKGHLALLRALSAIVGQRSFTLTFCGEEAGPQDRAYCRSLAETAQELGLGARLGFRNNVQHHEMSALYQAHDLFILPSRHEPAAVSPIEAAWNGCAVLMSKDGGTRGYLPAGSDFEFDPADPGDIARAVRDALQAPDHLADLRRRCRSHIAAVAGDDVILATFERMLP